MIVSRPTGEFLELLPKSEVDDASVIFTISNEIPPRPDLDFSIVTVGQERISIPKIHSINDRVRAAGELIFTTKVSQSDILGDGRKPFVTGEVLEFTEEDDTDINPKFVGDEIETKHNNNYPNYESFGITRDQDESIFDAALSAQQVILDSIAGLQERYKELQTEISDLKKEENEITRLLSAFSVVIDAGQDNDDILDAVQKLNSRLVVNGERRQTAIDEINAIPDDLVTKRDELNSITEIVK